MRPRPVPVRHFRPCSLNGGLDRDSGRFRLSTLRSTANTLGRVVKQRMLERLWIRRSSVTKTELAQSFTNASSICSEGRTQHNAPSVTLLFCTAISRRAPLTRKRCTIARADRCDRTHSRPPGWAPQAGGGYRDRGASSARISEFQLPIAAKSNTMKVVGIAAEKAQRR